MPPDVSNGSRASSASRSRPSSRSSNQASHQPTRPASTIPPSKNRPTRPQRPHTARPSHTTTLGVTYRNNKPWHIFNSYNTDAAPAIQPQLEEKAQIEAELKLLPKRPRRPLTAQFLTREPFIQQEREKVKIRNRIPHKFIVRTEYDSHWLQKQHIRSRVSSLNTDENPEESEEFPPQLPGYVAMTVTDCGYACTFQI